MRITTITATNRQQFKNLVKDYRSQGFEVKSLGKRNAELERENSTVVLGW